MQLMREPDKRDGGHDLKISYGSHHRSNARSVSSKMLLRCKIDTYAIARSKSGQETLKQTTVIRAREVGTKSNGAQREKAVRMHIDDE